MGKRSKSSVIVPTTTPAAITPENWQTAALLICTIRPASRRQAARSPVWLAAGAAVADDRWHQIDPTTLRAIEGMRNYDRRGLVDLFKNSAASSWNTIPTRKP